MAAGTLPNVWAGLEGAGPALGWAAVGIGAAALAYQWNQGQEMIGYHVTRVKGAAGIIDEGFNIGRSKALNRYGPAYYIGHTPGEALRQTEFNALDTNVGVLEVRARLTRNFPGFGDRPFTQVYGAVVRNVFRGSITFTGATGVPNYALFNPLEQVEAQRIYCLGLACTGTQ